MSLHSCRICIKKNKYIYIYIIIYNYNIYDYYADVSEAKVTQIQMKKEENEAIIKFHITISILVLNLHWFPIRQQEQSTVCMCS